MEGAQTVNTSSLIEDSSDVTNNTNCNRSELLEQHRNILLNLSPYNESRSWIHLTEKYQRKLFGRYGSESNVNPRICFVSKHEVISKDRYEQLSEPEMVLTMISKSKLDQNFKNEEILRRENDISKRIDKLGQWKQELHLRTMKKETDALAAKQKKERLIEEVRRHFGYKVDPRDERFKEVLEQKEREDKKKQKEAKRQAKEQKLMSKLVGGTPN